MEVDLAEKVLSSFLCKVLALSCAKTRLSAHTHSATHMHVHTHTHTPHLNLLSF